MSNLEVKKKSMKHHLKIIASNINYYGICSFAEVDSKIVPRESFERLGSNELFDSIRRNEHDLLKEILIYDRFLVF